MTVRLILYFSFAFNLTYGQKSIDIIRPSSFACLDTARHGIQTDKFVFLTKKSVGYQLDTVTSKIFLDSLHLFFVNNPTAMVEIDIKSFGVEKTATTMTLNIARSQSLVDFLVKNRHVDVARLFAAGPKCPMPILPPNYVHLKFIDPTKGVWTKITVLSHDFKTK